MPYLFNTEAEKQEMLQAVGVDTIDDLFKDIPESLRLNRALDLPPAMGELELTQYMSELAAKNQSPDELVCFLGGGSYDHFIPAVVDTIASRGEFYTSYTPYQPEVSQGNLQVMFEYQTLICQLTGMDVSNASLYDGGSAVAEAALLCMSVKKRLGKVVTSASVHPEYRQILSTYVTNLGCEVVTAEASQGATELSQLASLIDEETACVIIQYPNFFGCIEDVRAVAEMAHAAGALLVVSCDPISLGLLHRPGDMGADIVIAEGQSLGTPMQYGGPYLGIMACREQFVRRLPGRIAGQTVDRRGRRCWVLTLQTREQHIRREKATSNICTNQGLFALRAAVYMSLMGPRGMRQVAELCTHKAYYAAQQICDSDRFSLRFDQPTFKEFVVRDGQGQTADLVQQATEAGYLAGIELGQWYPELQDCLLVTVTEKRTKAEIDGLANCLSNVEKTTTVHA